METKFVLKKITISPMFGAHTQYLTRNDGFVSILLFDMRNDIVYFTKEQVDALYNENFLGQASGSTTRYGFEEIL